MLIRVSGRHDGVKQYLEEGRKVGRELDRDDLDERVVLVGDLDLTDAVIQSIDAPPKVERYLSITLSFKEDHVDRETLFQIARDFEAFAMHAYRPDEYSFYAEAHLPRVKSYVDQATGELVERKPHIHIVIPKLNLISGHTLRPFGFDKHNTHFIDAFQEHTNAKYGLASPKDNRRTLLTDASEMISRYRGDLFRANSRELKEQILDAVLDRQIESHDDFMALLHEHGAVRMRNAGRDDSYPNVKPAGAEKGVNLKEYVFTPAFIELPTAEKLQALSADAADQYEDGVAPRRTPDEVTALLDEWYASRARELKYLNSGSRQYQRYQESSPHDRQLMLAELERGFYAQHLKAHHDRADDTLPGLEGHLRRNGSAFEYGAQPSDAFDELDAGARELDVNASEWEPGWSAGDAPGRFADGYDDLDAQFDFVPAESSPAAEPFDGLRNVPGRPVDGVGSGSAVLLPDHALHQLEPDGAVSTDGMRWHPDRDGEPAAQRVSGPTPGELDAYHRALEAHYAFGDPFDKLPPMRPPATQVPTGMSPPDWFSDRRSDPFLDPYDVPFHLDAARPIAPRLPEIPADVAPYRSRRSRAGDDAFNTPRHTGRVSDNVLSQLARDRRQRDDVAGQAGEFRAIRQGLDARRLLAELSHTHGVRPAKYVVVTGRDGADRIRAGKRALNVSDFLTKELNLSWREAAPMLRAVYQRQQAGEPIPAPRELPRAALWREYSVAREAHVAARSDAWLAQRASEQQRRGEIRTAFETKRTAIKQDVRLSPADRRAATSLARAEQLGRDDALRESIALERASLKAQFGPAGGPSFSDWLRTRAEQGDERALEELRRTAGPDRSSADVDAGDDAFNVIRPNTPRSHDQDEHNAIIFRSPDLSWSVNERGHVTYRHDGRDVVRDRGNSVQVLQADRSAIETGLRLAQSKFGRTLELAGDDAHQLAAAKVAVDAGLRVQFSDARLNRAMDDYRHARVDQHVRDVLGTPGAGAPANPQPRPERPAPDQPTPSDNSKPTL
ncbi:LPD7 domain-containing protein [Burkholderia cenocepacia]|uniref:LPD7 domain-containing protein n=1 Tax=Burkholderia cenocepacia TaxID=95486 RepID=UPI00158D7B26|nr:LPD7 domain-containing protein [Burkholderia cenocepacia]